MKNKKKWGKKNIFCISVDPYKQDIIVVINGSFSDAIAYMKKLKTKGAKLNLEHIASDGGYTEEHTINGGRGETWTTLPHGYVLTISHQSSWIETVEIISHECLHLTHYILRNAGLVLCKESEEAYTYLQAYLLKEILREIY
tara:strand:+ start:12688 stop:13113 length:426 start_codon:yes stop_codon:yes gene_type:complete